MSDTYDYDDESDRDEEAEMIDLDECGLMPNGQCMLIGTEFCDWDCGRLNTLRIAAMKEAAQKRQSE